MEEIVNQQEKYKIRSAFFLGCIIGLTTGLVVFFVIVFLIAKGLIF